MAIQNNFPALKPTLLLDFANVGELDPRITFERASEGRFYGTQVAKAEENLLVNSQVFDGAGWVSSRVTLSANSGTAPDGTSTAYKVIPETASSSFKQVYQNFVGGVVSGVIYTSSIFAKADGYQFVQVIGTSAEFGTFAINYDLSSGVETQFAAGNSTILSRSITSVGNGWYRISVTATAIASGSSARLGINTIPASDSARGVSWSGNGTSGTLVWGAQYEQRSAVTAYTPTTDQPITNYIPVLQTAAAGVARFDHNPTTGESLGLLIEEQRTNLFERSEEFDNAYWTKTRSSITANTIVAPDGTLTGDKLVENTDTNTHIVTRSFTPVGNTTYTFSVYLKKAERDFANVFIGTFSNQVAANTVYVNLAAGTIVSASDPSRTTLTNVGNGWYRVTTTVTTIASPSGFISPQVHTSVNGTTSNYTGDGYSGIYIWGAQLEAGSFPTSYIPTAASQVTRSADAASMTGANFSSWYNLKEGAVYAEAQTSAQPSSTYHYIASINQGSSSFSAGGFLRVSFNTSPKADLTIGNYGSFTTINTAGFPTLQYGVFSKMAIAWQDNDAAGTSNGVTPSTTTARLTVAPVDTLFIGSQLGSTRFLNGTIKKLSYYPKRLSNTEIQGLTS